MNKEIYEFGAFRLDASERSIERLDGGSMAALPEKTFLVLLYLIRKRGHLVSKDEILEAVWPDAFVEEGNVDRRVHMIRQYLGQDQKDRYVETVRKHGYRFVSEVRRLEVSGSWLPDIYRQTLSAVDPGSDRGLAVVDPDFSTVESSSSNADRANELQVSQDHHKLSQGDAVASSASHRFKPRPIIVYGVVLGTTIAVVLSVLALGPLSVRLFGAKAVRLNSLAVFPFSNTTGDPSQEYLAVGIADALSNDIAKLSSFRVAPRQSIVEYANGSKPVAGMTKALGVDGFVRGAFQGTADRISVTIELNDNQNKVIWHKSYDSPRGDLLLLQKKITRDLIENLGRGEPAIDIATIDRNGAASPKAFDEFLRGKYLFQRQTPKGNAEAIKAFQASVEIDPNFAAAHAYLAQAYVWKLFLFAPKEKDVAEKAYVSVERALLLDPSLAVAYLARGRLLWTPMNSFPHERAINEYRHALELDPNLDEARNQLALVYNHIGAFDAALEQLRRAVETNPDNNVARFRIGQTLMFQGRFEEGITALQSTPKDANPALTGHQMVWALLQLGRGEEASDLIEKLVKENVDQDRGLFSSQLAILSALHGDHAKAEKYIREAIQTGDGFGHFHHTSFYIACAYAVMGRNSEAIDWLQNAANDGFPCYSLFERDRFLAGLREDERYRKFIDDLKLRWQEQVNSAV